MTRHFHCLVKSSKLDKAAVAPMGELLDSRLQNSTTSPGDTGQLLLHTSGQAITSELSVRGVWFLSFISWHDNWNHNPTCTNSDYVHGQSVMSMTASGWLSVSEMCLKWTVMCRSNLWTHMGQQRTFLGHKEMTFAGYRWSMWFPGFQHFWHCKLKPQVGSFTSSHDGHKQAKTRMKSFKWTNITIPGYIYAFYMWHSSECSS